MIDEPSSYLDVRQRLKAAQVRCGMVARSIMIGHMLGPNAMYASALLSMSCSHSYDRIFGDCQAPARADAEELVLIGCCFEYCSCVGAHSEQDA